MLGGMQNMAAKDASMRAHCRLTQCALVVEQFRETYSRLPGSLVELAPRFLPVVPEDPFDGKPLRYRVFDEGYLIYSIDEDGQDDGGREREYIEEEYVDLGSAWPMPLARPGEPAQKPKQTYDITFTCRRK